MIRTYYLPVWKILICSLIVFNFVNGTIATNLTCYQCERNDEEPCDLKYLKPCPSSFDRCAVHMEKNAQTGLTVKRKCGLAPCGFDDEMMARGLGMNCDRSKNSYSCIYCCKENGCNINAADTTKIAIILKFTLIILCVFYVVRDFIPPFVQMDNTHFEK